MMLISKYPLMLLPREQQNCIAKLIKVTEELGKNIGIQGYSIGVGIGGYLTFAINYAPVSIK